MESFPFPTEAPPLVQVKKSTPPVEKIVPDPLSLAMIEKATTKRRNRLGATKLDEIQFDPIDRLVEQLAQLDSMIALELARGENSRVSALTGFTSAKIKILETLLPYAYGKVDREDNSALLDGEPLEIKLVLEDKSYDSNSSGQEP